MTARVERALRGLSLFAAVTMACGDSGPASLTSPTGVTGTSDISAKAATAHDLGIAQTGALDDFDCSSVETVRVRFSSPGYVEYDRVGLYVYFDGLAQGPKRLRVWWDYENDAVHFSDFLFDEEETEIEEVYEHRYLNLRDSTEMLVRVELIRDGLTGNCPRNRRVTVAPPPPGSGPPAPPAATTQTASVGPPISNVDNYDVIYTEGVRFTVLTPLTIDSVAVDPSGNGTLTVNLWDSSGSTLLSSRSTVVAAGPQQIALGFSLPAGTYLLDIDTTTVPFPGVGMSFNGSNFPYVIPGVIELTDTNFFFGGFGWYFFLYDWQVTW
jgi:hypothetical protein